MSPFHVRNVGLGKSVTVRVREKEVTLEPGQTVISGWVETPNQVRVIRRKGDLIDLVMVGDYYEEDESDGQTA